MVSFEASSVKNFHFHKESLLQLVIGTKANDMIARVYPNQAVAWLNQVLYKRSYFSCSLTVHIMVAVYDYYMEFAIGSESITASVERAFINMSYNSSTIINYFVVASLLEEYDEK